MISKKQANTSSFNLLVLTVLIVPFLTAGIAERSGLWPGRKGIPNAKRPVIDVNYVKSASPLAGPDMVRGNVGIKSDCMSYVQLVRIIHQFQMLWS